MNKDDFTRWKYLLNTKSEKIHRDSYKFIEKINNLRKIGYSYLDSFKGETCWVLELDNNLQVEEIIFRDYGFLVYSDTLCYFPLERKWINSHHHLKFYEINQP